MSRNLLSVTMTEMTGHDAEMGGHVGPKYPVGAPKATAVRRNAGSERRLAVRWLR
jgi:hypothetical protein